MIHRPRWGRARLGPLRGQGILPIMPSTQSSSRLRVVLVSKALVVGAYQRKAEEIAAQGVTLTVFTPPSWRDRRGAHQATPLYTAGYDFCTLPIRWNGSFHLHHYPTLARELARLRPDVLHMDEEPYNLATYLALRAAQQLKIPALFFAWQNIRRSYPPPFAWWERAVYAMARHAIAGNQDAAAVLRAKGYDGPITVLPQFGVDPAIFAPPVEQRTAHDPAQPTVIGYAGGLVAEKGVDLLLEACAGLTGAWTLRLAGEGERRAALVEQARHLGIADRVRWEERIPTHAMPAFYHGLDVLVLPSRTRPNWKEQFGRVLIEAMSCGVAVVGSDSGEIPRVSGSAGLVFPEGDAAALRDALQTLLDDRARRAALGAAGRQRVLQQFTMQRIAAETVAVYREVAARSSTI